MFGGELTSLDGVEFRDLKDLDIVGIYPNYAEAHAAWKAAAQRTVDNAMMRYFVVHMHRLLEPDDRLEGARREPGAARAAQAALGPRWRSTSISAGCSIASCATGSIRAGAS